MFAIVEDNLKTPVRAPRNIFVGLTWGEVATAYPLHIPIGRTAQFGTIFFLGLAKINVDRVLRFVFVGDHVTPVIVTFTHQPAKDTRWFLWIGDAGVPMHPIERRHVILRERSPVHAACLQIRPTLDAGKQSLYSGSIGRNTVGHAMRQRPILMLASPPTILFDEQRNEILA